VLAALAPVRRPAARVLLQAAVRPAAPAWLFRTPNRAASAPARFRQGFEGRELPASDNGYYVNF
jgi:hypothetical protein